MSSGANAIAKLVACAACVIAPVMGDTINWTATESGDWDVAANWDGVAPPGSSDDAKHLTKLNHINVTGDESALSFEGNGGNNSDRFLLVEGSNTWTIGTGGLKKSTSSTDLFRVDVQGGTSSDLTQILVGSGGTGDMDGIVLARGNWVKIAVANDLLNSDLTLVDDGIIDVEGDVFDTSIGVRDRVDIDVEGDVSTNTPGSNPASWVIEDDGNVDIKGNATGVTVTIGTALAGAAEETGVRVGSIGDCAPTTCAIQEDWTLNGYAKLEVTDDEGYGTGHFRGSSSHSDVVMNDHASMTVEGATDKALWTLNDDSGFVGTGGITEGTWWVNDNATVVALSSVTDGSWNFIQNASWDVNGTISGCVCSFSDDTVLTSNGATCEGTWTLYDNAVVTVGNTVDEGTWTLNGDSKFIGSDTVSGGTWTVNSDGGGGSNYGVDVAPVLNGDAAFNPDTLVLDGGTVLCHHMGFDVPGGPDSSNHPIWDLHMKNYSKIVVDSGWGWHESADSEIQFTNSGNEYTLKSGATGITIGGPLVGNGAPKLKFTVEQGSNVGYIDVEAELVSFNGSGDTSLLDFDAENVTVDLVEHSCAGSVGNIEAVGPDYGLSENGPLFVDSPCVRRWGTVSVVNGTAQGTLCSKVTDVHPSTPISGGGTEGRCWRTRCTSSI